MRSLLKLTTILVVSSLFSCSPKTEKAAAEQAVFTVSHPYNYDRKSEMIYLKISDLEQKYQLKDFSQVQLINMNTHQSIDYSLYDSNKDEVADVLGFEMTVAAKEALRPFALQRTTAEYKHKLKAIDSYENKLKVTYLHPAKEVASEDINWSTTLAQTFMGLYPEACDLEIFSPHKWTYTNGFFTNALCELYTRTNDAAYLNYAKKWMDCFVAEDGSIEKYVQEKYRLDDVLPGRTLLYLYENEPEEKYKIAADNFIHHIEHQPRNSDGGYWHKKVYANQMWLDGIYMGDVYTAQYAALFKQPELFDEAVLQIKLIYKHTLDSVSGLMYHGYDESLNDVWADPVKGTSPEFWGRGMGWYMMALVDVLEYLPEDHPDKAGVIQILNETAAALAKVQDEKTGLWYQVLDKGEKEDNWIETSCAAMFAYAYAKGANLGYLPAEYRQKAENAFDGLLQGYVYLDEANNFYLTETVHVGTLNFKNSDGSYNYYINVDRRINDFKGVAAFLYLAMALDK